MKDNTKVHRDKENVWAKNIQDEEVFIGDVPRGRKGYFCLGCDKELIAKKGKLRIMHFAHDAKDVTHTGKCSYSDETYRHWLAKELLKRYKEVKVPAVYKYPPKGEDGAPMLIRDKHYIKAAKVQAEIEFYEDDNGKICWGKQVEQAGKNKLIRPDIAFFNEKDEPILLIELVATNGLTVEKKAIIRFLGIDTIRINIPKSSQKEIEDSLKKTSSTKWIYNNESENTQYVRISNGGSTIIPSIDEIERGFFEETYRCRTTEIGNLLRSIRRCLESEQYTKANEAFRDELERVARNTIDHRLRSEEIRRDCRSRVKNRYQSEYDKIETIRSSLENRRTEQQQKYQDQLRFIELERENLEREFAKKTSNLEERYKRARSRVKEAEERVRGEFRDKLAESGITGESFDDRKRELEQLISSKDLSCRTERANIEGIRSRINKEHEIFESDKSRLRENNNRIESALREDIHAIEERRGTIPSRFESKAREAEQRAEELRESTNNQIEARDGKGNSELSRELKGVLHYWRLLNDFQKQLDDLRRIKAAQEFIKSGDYKEEDTW